MDESAPNSKMTPTEILDAAEEATVRIQVDNENSGTGLILQKEGAYVMILTCYHVIQRAISEAESEIDILFSNLHRSRVFKPVSRRDHTKDFGLLFGYDKYMINMNLKSIGSFAEIEDAFQEIFCCSFPYGVDYAMRVAGRLSQVQLDDYIAYDLGVATGSSGAAILNDRAQILAVHIKGEKAPVYVEEDDALIVTGYTGGVVKYGITAYEIHKELKHLTDKLSRPDLYHQSIDGTIVNLFRFFREEEEERARREKAAMKQQRKEKKARREEKGEKKRKD